MDVPSREEFEAAIQLLQDRMKVLQKQIKDLGRARTVWIDQALAVALTGRSRTWFYEQRTAGTLPIAMLPRTEGSRRLKYSEADCIAYGQQHKILPPE